MRLLILLVGLIAATSATAANPPQMQRVKQATFLAPFAYPADPVYLIHSARQPFRWGWFGAEHYPPAPAMHRDYNNGWREWHYRR